MCTGVLRSLLLLAVVQQQLLQPPGFVSAIVITFFVAYFTKLRLIFSKLCLVGNQKWQKEFQIGIQGRRHLKWIG